MKKVIKFVIGMMFLGMFLAIGLYLLIAVSMMFKENMSSDSDIIVSGEIIEVVSKEPSKIRGKRGSGGPLYAPKVSFEYQNKDYTIISSTSTSWNNYQKGESVEVKVDPENPSDSEVATGSLNLVFLIFALLASLFFVGIPGLIIFSIIRKLIVKHKLKTKGRKFNLAITGFDEKYIRNRNKTNFYIKANYQDSKTGEMIELKSQKLEKDPKDVFKIGDSVAVVINPENPKQYYFELEDLK